MRLIIVTARLFGTRAVADLVKALEGDEEAMYDTQGDSPDIEAIAADEREHAEIWRRLDGEGNGTGAVTRSGAPPRPAVTAAEHPAVAAGTAAAPEAIAGASAGTGARARGRCGRSSSASATAWCSNLSLVMGVAGASAGRRLHPAGRDRRPAGRRLLDGRGEYISMQSQRELFERQIELERAELEAMPDEEQRELAALYMAKGFPRAEATRSPSGCSATRRPRSTRSSARSSASIPTSSVAVGRGHRLVPRVRRRAP